MADQKFFARMVKWLGKLFPSHRAVILKAAAKLTTWAASLAIVSGVVSYAINGREFFTEKLPRAVSYVAKTVLLGATLRPVLVRHVMEHDLGYSDMCIDGSDTLDLDNDGDASDLVLTFYPPAQKGICDDPGSVKTVYAVMKLIEWHGVWPKYQSVATLGRTGEGKWGVETGLPLTFQSYGSFLVAHVHGTDFPGYEVFGYANGELHSYGRFWPIGATREVEDENSEPVLQIGNRMFLNTEEGIFSVSIPDHGAFAPPVKVSSLEVVKRNNAAMILERFDQMPESEPEPEPGTPVVPTQKYEAVEPPPASDSACSFFLFANGAKVTLESRKGDGDATMCIGKLEVARSTIITPRLPCAVEGMHRTTQFPWGYVYDASSAQHSIACPLDGDHENSFEFKLDVVLRD